MSSFSGCLHVSLFLSVTIDQSTELDFQGNTNEYGPIFVL